MVIFLHFRRTIAKEMEAIDSVRINFNPDQLRLLNICLAFLMFGVALDLKPENFRVLFRQPRKPLLGLTSQWVLLPVLTLVLIFTLRPAPSLALGMLLVAACPGGNVSNYAVHLARGNAALSILMTSVSTLAAVVVTPLYFGLLAPLIPGTEAIRQSIAVEPGSMVLTIIQLIILPLAAGMALHHYLPRLTGQVRQPVRVLSMLIFVGFVVVALIGNWANLVAYLHIIFLLVFLHNALALAMGYQFARWNRLDTADSRAIAIETGIQNSGLGLILIFNFFNGLGGMAIVAAWWGIWHLISAFTLAAWWNARPVKFVPKA